MRRLNSKNKKGSKTNKTNNLVDLVPWVLNSKNFFNLNSNLYH